ncbi:cytosolic phospholipase A2 gamma-like [Erpetoichthys calabaricus]|uniref:cytosolic phospholipase A2 gamma-like n=1 Tax=Erpetoichthys calabaricus TaxID=27687 RepID=UPI0022347955|nr:cytosolic phospholipase A2 gamma-like [Erpetoichthys calabaricus]
MSTKIIGNFYSCIVESILTSSITMWKKNADPEPKADQRIPYEVFSYFSLQVRFSSQLSDGELCAVDARKTRVAQALEQLLGRNVSKSEVPTIAVLGSGGSLRAMISFLGSMSGFLEAGLLDCVTYLCGVSGSTWAMSSLNENVEWSNDFAATNDEICSNLVNANFDFDDLINILKREEYLLKRLEAAAYKEDYSVTDLWGTVVSRILGKEYNQKLSKQQDGVMNGQNPYPVYAAINKEYFDCDKKNKHPEIWFEFTPHECGFPSYGAFVETQLFGSKFVGLEITEYHPEPSLYFLQALWGSAMADLKALEEYFIAADKKWAEECDRPSDEEEHHRAVPGTKFLHMAAKSAEVITSWKFGTKFNYLYQCKQFSKPEKKNIFGFLGDTAKKDPKQVGHHAFVSLVDAGLEINCAYPLMLRAERKVDVIISVDFSAGDIFETLVEAKQYAKVNCLPFPPVKINNKVPNDCNVYSDPATLTVIHIPLANSVNANEMDISEFPTEKLKYNKTEIAKLFMEAKNNITRNKTKILEEIKKKMHPL